MDLYGPPLPPGYVRPMDDESENSEEDTISLQAEAPKVIGPQLPRNPSQNKSISANENNAVESDNSESANMIGPILPTSVLSKRHADSVHDDFYGPTLSQINQETNDVNEMKAVIEKRAKNMKNKLDNKSVLTDAVIEREEWMTVPDTSRKNQLGAISRCLAPEKSSPKIKHSHRHSEKDKKTSAELKKYNKSKRSESLLEMHKKDIKKKEKEKKSKHKERKAFDRDEMDIKQFTKTQVTSVIDKAKFLNSRFAPGNSQYL